MNRVFITGDIHGEIDIRKLNNEFFPEGQNLTKDDYVIICGDFGLVWGNPQTKREIWWINWLTDKPWTTLFVDGNHENHKLLNSYEIVEWNGGRVHMITESIIHLMRGEYYEIAGYSIFTFGGGFSHDIYRRTENISWWQEEMPNKYEITNAIYNLERNNYKADIIITHDAPKSIHDYLGYHRVDMKPYDIKYENLSNFLEYIRDATKFRAWFLGHYHIDKNIMGHHFLYNNIIEITPAILEK